MPARPAHLSCVALLALASLGLAGCTVPGTLAGGTATAGVAVVQERSVGSALDDAIITTAVGSNLLQYQIDLVRAVEVEVVEGRVLLTGKVEQPDDRVDAVRLAWLAEGVVEVLNEIQVTDEGGIVNYARDTWIGTQLRTKLLLDMAVRAINYNIEVVNGVVYMIGIARDQGELERVTNHARTIKNVIKVVSHVRVKGAPAS